jgi:hypothetical protein
VSRRIFRSKMKPGSHRNKDEEGRSTEQISANMIEDHLKELMNSLSEMNAENLKSHEENLRKHQETNERMGHVYQHLDKKSDVHKEMRERLDIVEEKEVEKRRDSLVTKLSTRSIEEYVQNRIFVAPDQYLNGVKERIFNLPRGLQTFSSTMTSRSKVFLDTLTRISEIILE